MKYRKGNNDWIGMAATTRKRGLINNSVYLFFLCNNRSEQLTRKNEHYFGQNQRKIYKRSCVFVFNPDRITV
jgi:hypothetical protein